MTHCELMIIGGGPGGYVAAIRARQLGIETVLVDRDALGGTCMNRGCIPTKALIHTAELYDELKHADEIGLKVSGASVDFDALRAHKDEIVDQLNTGVASLLKANGVEVIKGNARIGANREVRITCADGTVQEYSADQIIVATGTKPAMPPIEGIHEEGIYTSDNLLAGVPELKSLAIVGGGVIGMEFAGLYTALGTKVSVLEGTSRILPTMDKEFGRSLSMVMKQKGCDITCDAFVKSIAKTDSGYTVTYTRKDEEFSVEAEAVLISTGRVTDLSDVFDEDCMPESNRGRILVDKSMRTSLEGVYAIGDIANAGPQLAHAASAQGIVAVSAIAGVNAEINLDIIPGCVYTSPEIASVGLTLEEAKEAGINARNAKFVMTSNGKSLITNQGRTFMKVVVDENDKIIGAQLMCGRATDIIGEFSLAIARGLSVSEMANVVRPHPTFEEGVTEVCDALLDGAIHALPKRK
ncbi:MAG: dihydrolipoyl dehydrogenase [Eggerthellaceae bacterium]|jgi:dihydrolipoamide dehydrogenase